MISLKNHLPQSLRGELSLVFVLSILLATYLYLPALTDPDRFHDNWRQSPHWLPAEQQRFQQDDPIIAYTRFNISPFGNFLYRTLSLSERSIVWGKVNTLIFFAGAATVLFLTVRTMKDRLAACIATVVFCLFPTSLQFFSGGFMSGLSIIPMILTVYIIHKRAWWYSLVVLLGGALIYPVIAVQSGMMFLLDALFRDRHDLKNRRLWKSKYLPLIIASLLGFLVLQIKYHYSSSEFGHLVNRQEIDSRLEFTHKYGRASVIPVPPLYEQFLKQWGDLFHVVLILSVYLVLGHSMWKLPRGLYALFWSGIVLYWIADIFLFKLYFPNRYIVRTLPVFTAMVSGIWISDAIKSMGNKQIGWTSKFLSLKADGRLVLLSLLLISGIVSFHSKMVPFRFGTYRYSKHKIYKAVKKLPGKPLVAAHPSLASELPLLTGTSVLVTKEMTHPWWTEYWRQMSARTSDMLRAYYAKEPAPLLQLLHKYPVDYVLVRFKDFERDYRTIYRNHRKRVYFEPFATLIVKELEPSRSCLLYRVPESICRVYDGDFYIVSAKKLRKWLLEQNSPLEGRE